MFASDTTAFVEAGRSLIIGTVGADGAPDATRGWGITVLDVGTGEILLLLDADDAEARSNLLETGAIAITATDVPTLRSLQMKGTCVTIAPATEVDAERSARYCDEFFTEIEATERTPRELLEHVEPVAVVACTVRVNQLFDQTPGPGAGTPVPEGGSA